VHKKTLKNVERFYCIKVTRFNIMNIPKEIHSWLTVCLLFQIGLINVVINYKRMKSNYTNLTLKKFNWEDSTDSHWAYIFIRSKIWFVNYKPKTEFYWIKTSMFCDIFFGHLAMKVDLKFVMCFCILTKVFLERNKDWSFRKLTTFKKCQ